MSQKRNSKPRFKESSADFNKSSILDASGSLQSETPPIVNFRQDMINFFYSELLKYVVDEFSLITNDKPIDSDEEPTYDVQSRTESEDDNEKEAGPLKPIPRVNMDSRSKLRSHVLVNQSYGYLEKYKSHISTQDIGQGDGKMSKIRYKLSQANSMLQEKFSTTLVEMHDSVEATSTDPYGELHHTNASGDTNYNTEKQCTNSVSTSEDLFLTENAVKKLVNIKFNTGLFFRGELQHFRFNGRGAFKWPEGVVYEGEFKNSRITGFGKIIYRDGSYYEGTFINGVLHGAGNFSASRSNTSYSGDWANGVPHGIGQLRFSETNSYDGAWVNGVREGFGTRIYANKAIYVGNWSKGNPSGKGTMLYSNRDLYHGEWADGKPNGFGQYIWQASLIEGLVYNMVNSYSGHFVNGVRDGYGVQSFGMEGSKLASIFDDNMKSGAGILVCGDGTSIERKPLFLMDNPLPTKAYSVALTKDSVSFPQLNTDLSISYSKRAKSAYSSVMKEPCTDKSSQMHSKASSAFPSVESKSIPLNTPLYANAKDINLTYHVTRFINRFYSEKMRRSALDDNFFVSKTTVQWDTNENQSDSMFDEEYRLLKRTIANNYVYLREVYQKYATSNPLHPCVQECRNPVMSRLKLYQFLRDIRTHEFNMSLLDVDNAMLEIPLIGLESEHDPFEQIYMWQFMHCILILSYAMHDHNQQGDNVSAQSSTKIYPLQKSRYHSILNELIQNVIKPNDCNFEGRALFACKDVLPIKQVYELYKTLGEPHTARTLLCRICHKKGEEPISCFASYRKVYGPKGTEKHFVLGDVNILFLESENKMPWHMKETTKLNKYVDDPFYTDLRVFRNLGPELVVKCITSICPLILDDGDIVRIDYLITFLEFYEILINLAEEMGKMKKEEKEDQLDNMEGIRASQVRASGLIAYSKNDSGKQGKKKTKKRKGD